MKADQKARGRYFTVPESSTWAIMPFGFAGLALAGYRRAKAGPRVARQVG
jgi:hypothetical protein